MMKVYPQEFRNQLELSNHPYQDLKHNKKKLIRDFFKYSIDYHKDKTIVSFYHSKIDLIR